MTSRRARPAPPSLFERALRRLGYLKWRPASVIHRVETMPLDDIAPNPSPEFDQGSRYAGVYLRSPWVYVAVNRIVEAAALVPFRVYARPDGRGRRAGDFGSGPAGALPAEVARPDHPFTRLLQHPNPLMSRFELLEHTLGNLEIHGNAYWFLAGEPGGIPRELWPLRPDRVSIVPDAARGVRGYVYEVDGRRIPLDAAEVIHFRRWHPANDYYGLSALEAARLAVESDRAMADWNHRYFGEGLAVPAGIVAIRERVSDADFERLKREWRTAYGGRERKTAFLRGASVEWHSVGLSQHDMDFLNARRFNREEIFQIFGIPVGIFSENATEANALVGERIFVERTLWPKLVRLAEKITTDLLPFYGADLVGRFDDIRPQDRAQTFAEMRLARGILSVNEMRGRYFQLDAVPWGKGPVPGDAPDYALARFAAPEVLPAPPDHAEFPAKALPTGDPLAIPVARVDDTALAIPVGGGDPGDYADEAADESTNADSALGGTRSTLDVAGP